MDSRGHVSSSGYVRGLGIVHLFFHTQTLADTPRAADPTMSLAAATSSLSCRKAFYASPRRQQATARGRLQVQAYKVGAPLQVAANFSTSTFRRRRRAAINARRHQHPQTPLPTPPQPNRVCAPTDHLRQREEGHREGVRGGGRRLPARRRRRPPHRPQRQLPRWVGASGWRAGERAGGWAGGRGWTSSATCCLQLRRTPVSWLHHLCAAVTRHDCTTLPSP